MRGPVLRRTDHRDDEAGIARPALVWELEDAAQTIATTILGGGIALRRWLVNAEVSADYRHADPAAHAASIASELDLPTGDGSVFLTAASVLKVVSADDGGTRCDATVGLSTPTWAAVPEGAVSEWQPGTINLVCWVPAPMSDAALANLVATATEAKVQALIEAGVPGTGTATDAVAVLCPPGGSEPYGGPRSRWGACLARAVHAAVWAGLAPERSAS